MEPTWVVCNSTISLLIILSTLLYVHIINIADVYVAAHIFVELKTMVQLLYKRKIKTITIATNSTTVIARKIFSFKEKYVFPLILDGSG